MYNGGPNAVRSGNKKAINYANSVLNIMETIEPFKFDSFKEDDIKESEIPDAFKGSQEQFLGADSFDMDESILSAQLMKELHNLKREIDNVTDSSKDNTTMLQDGKKLLEEAYEIIRQIEERSVTFKDRVEKSFPEGSPFVDRILDDKTEEEKQSIVARPKRFVQ